MAKKETATTIRRKKTKRIKKKLDAICREIVRLRDDWTCQKCGLYLLHDTPIQKCFAHTAHIVSRSRHHLRWALWNLILIDQNCHRWAHRHPLEVAEWFRLKFPVRYDYLMKRKNENKQVKLEGMEELYEQHKQKLEQLQREAK